MTNFDWLKTQSVASMKESGWLDEHLPEVARLYGVPQNLTYHPEGDTGIHVELSVQAAISARANLRTLFATLIHDVGKGVTPAELLPSHPGHEKSGIPLVEDICAKHEVPEDWKALALLVVEHHLHCHRILEITDKRIAHFFVNSGLMDRPTLVRDFWMACMADKRGRPGSEHKLYLQGIFIETLLPVAIAHRELSVDHTAVEWNYFVEAIRNHATVLRGAMCM